MTSRSVVGALAATVILAACGASTGERPSTTARPGGVETTSAAGATETRPPPSAADGPFDLSVLGPSWKMAAQPFEPPPPRPSDCAELDRLTADFHAWATTQRSYRVDGRLILEVNARAADAAAAASFLNGQSNFMIGCSTVRYQTGGVTRIQPASSRKFQTMYPLRHDNSDEQLKIITIKDVWIIRVSVFDASNAPSPLVASINATLLDQALA